MIDQAGPSVGTGPSKVPSSPFFDKDITIVPRITRPVPKSKT